jgi:endonuclease/exonuclease/phosphatase family metal-dependent hydrolase
VAGLRLAAWNVAWFARLFDRRDRLVADEAASAMPGVTRRRQAEAIAAVIARIDPDLLAVIEAPNTGRTQSAVAALETFAAAYGLRQRAALAGFESPTHQEIALLFDPDRVAAEHAPLGEPMTEAAARAGHSPLAAPRFDSVFADTGTVCRFSKPPLEAAVRDGATGLAFRLIAVHLKSQAPNMESSDEARTRRIARNRALQLGQAAWIRARVAEHLAADEPLAVLGDFNDGPAGPGESPSSVEVVAGGAACAGDTLVNPWLAGDLPPAPTARFSEEQRDRAAGGAPGFADAMVDFILLSRGLAPADPACWRIWHPARDPECAADPALAAALRDASDHYPVSVDLTP